MVAKGWTNAMSFTDKTNASPLIEVLKQEGW